MSEHQPLDYRLRCHSKRTDLPPDVLRDICEAYDLIHEGRQVSVTPTPRTDIAAMQGFIDNDFDGGLMPASVVSSKFSRKLEMEINQLRKERDDARREVCYAEINGQYGRRYTPQDIAKKMGWDCFKSVTESYEKIATKYHTTFQKLAQEENTNG
jgi:hypothetical protein